MPRHYASALLAISLLLPPLAFAQTPNPGNSRAAPPSAAPTKPAPDPPPLPPDVVAVEPTADTTHSGNAVTRTLKRLAPNCINGIFHACWSSPPQKAQAPRTDESQGAESREVAEFYFERGNYRAAESRFREALQYNVHDTKAMFELAQCLEKLQRTTDAVTEYRLCVDEGPGNPYADRARKALLRLSETSKAAVPNS